MYHPVLTMYTTTGQGFSQAIRLTFRYLSRFLFHSWLSVPLMKKSTKIENDEIDRNSILNTNFSYIALRMCLQYKKFHCMPNTGKLTLLWCILFWDNKRMSLMHIQFSHLTSCLVPGTQDGTNYIPHSQYRDTNYLVPLKIALFSS